MNPERLVRDLAEHLRTQPLPPTRDGLLAELMHMIACKGAVKAGQPLSPLRKSTALLAGHLVANSHHCPHGRPTALVFTKADLEKQFGRDVKTPGRCPETQGDALLGIKRCA